MTETLFLGCAGLLVLFALVRGYTAKVLSQLRRDYAGLVAQVRQLESDHDQAQILHESAEAQRNQLDGACKDFRNELESLAQEIAKTEEDLGHGAVAEMAAEEGSAVGMASVEADSEQDSADGQREQPSRRSSPPSQEGEEAAEDDGVT